MAKKMTLEDLLMPLIDDAANVFYSKLVSVLDALWGQTFVYKAWCGWHRHRQVGFKWKYGGFSSYNSDRKCVIDLNTIDLSKVPVNGFKYLRAVYYMDLSKILIDTTEGITNTGGAPVPTYRIDPDNPLTLIGYTLSDSSADITYGKGIGEVCVKTSGDGIIESELLPKELPKPFMTLLIGRIFNDSGVVTDFDPIYNNGMLPFDTFGFTINRKTTIYSSEQHAYLQGSLDTNEISQGTKYEWDCGRVMEYSTGNTLWWKYYSVDSDGTKWLMESSDHPNSTNPEFRPPFLSNLCDTRYFLDGTCFKTEVLGDRTYRVSVWRVGTHVYPEKSANLFLKFTPNKMHNVEPFTNRHGEVEYKGIPRHKLPKLTKSASRFLYSRHCIPCVEDGEGGNVIFRDLLNNSVLFVSPKLVHRSAYDIAKNYTRHVETTWSCNYLLMLILAVSNVSAHYLFSGNPSNSLTWRIASQEALNQIGSLRSLTNADMKLITKYSVGSFAYNANHECVPKWQDIQTPYVFIENKDRSQYKSDGGTLCKFVNVGTQEAPSYYKVSRHSTKADDYGPDKIGENSSHTFRVDPWTESDVNKYRLANPMNVTIPGYYAKSFAYHDPNNSAADPMTDPTWLLSTQWRVFAKNLENLFPKRGLTGGAEYKPILKTCFIDEHSMGEFLYMAKTGNGMKLSLRNFNGRDYIVAE